MKEADFDFERDTPPPSGADRMGLAPHGGDHYPPPGQGTYPPHGGHGGHDYPGPAPHTGMPYGDRDRDREREMDKDYNRSYPHPGTAGPGGMGQGRSGAGGVRVGGQLPPLNRSGDRDPARETYDRSHGHGGGMMRPMDPPPSRGQKVEFMEPQLEKERPEANIMKFDPDAQTGTYMYLSVTGQIECGEFRNLDGICVKYDFIIGNKADWDSADSVISGISQHAFKNDSNDKRLVWNFPFEVQYKTLSICGWPQLVLTCSGKDFLGREIGYAYGCVHVPTQPGRHERYIRLFSPVSSNWVTRAMVWFTGKYAEYFDPPKLIAEAQGREVTRVKSHGIIKVVFQVNERNMKKFGYFT